MSEWMNNKWSQTHQPEGLWLLSHSAEATTVFVFLPLSPQTFPPTASPMDGAPVVFLVLARPLCDWLLSPPPSCVCWLDSYHIRVGWSGWCQPLTCIRDSWHYSPEWSSRNRCLHCLLGKRQDGPIPHMGLAWSLTHFFHMPFQPGSCPRQLHPL